MALRRNPLASCLEQSKGFVVIGLKGGPAGCKMPCVCHMILALFFLLSRLRCDREFN